MVVKLLAVAVTAFAVTACAADTGSVKSVAAPAPPVSCGGTGTTLSVAKASNGAADLLTTGKLFPAKADLLAAGPTGELLIERGRTETVGTGGGAPTSLPGTLAVLDPATGREQLVRGKDDLQPGTHTVFADLDRDHVVWQQETSTTLDVSDWTLVAADRETGAITRLAAAKPVDAQGLKPTVPGYTIPRLHEGTVYWAEARRGVAGKRPVVGIHARPVDASAPERLVVANAILPAVTGSWLYYVDFDGENASRPGYAIHRLSLRTGRTETVQRSETGPGVQFLAADGDSVAWALTDSTVQVRRTADEPVLTIAPEGEQLGWLSADRGLVGFGDGSGEANGAYVLDVRRGCLHVLAAKGSSVVIGGSTVAWTSETADGGRQRLVGSISGPGLSRTE
ncbi:hypothetical protein [Tenggerimyces flavus]|uniref:Lipoprotein n=1 Tax=Tenggerimyces flavus TaxID=1708749 RepID=A0ABV7Y2D0_9ACTN|nr:hypothetical protein [Tenggerimyces flavus]MBM7790753.1 hypothetical protein [Tenggerimyces flavus]